MVGGSADLAGSNNSLLKGELDYGPEASGRNMHWGVREHAMGACVNGMALHGGVRPYGATFLIFTGYCFHVCGQQLKQPHSEAGQVVRPGTLPRSVSDLTDSQSARQRALRAG